MSFFGLFGKQESADTFGVNINNRAAATELKEIGEKWKRTNDKFNIEIGKYKKLNEISKKQSVVIRENFAVMIDMSRLLNSYAEFINIIKKSIAEANANIGTMKLEDFQYLENLTRSKLDQLRNTFGEQATGVKALYEKYGNPEAAKLLDETLKKSADISSSADSTLSELSASLRSGGERKKKKPNHIKKK